MATETNIEKTSAVPKMTGGGLTILLTDRKVVTTSGRMYEVSTSEALALVALMSCEGQVVRSPDETFRYNIRRLRRRMYEEDAERIMTVRGQGYMLPRFRETKEYDEYDLFGYGPVELKFLGSRLGHGNKSVPLTYTQRLVMRFLIVSRGWLERSRFLTECDIKTTEAVDCHICDLNYKLWDIQQGVEDPIRIAGKRRIGYKLEPEYEPDIKCA